MTLYRRALLFTGWTLFVFVTFIWWMSLLHQYFGERGAVLGLAFWLSHGVAMMLLFNCPNCGCSAYASNKGLFTIWTPWPARKCRACGHDHNLN